MSSNVEHERGTYILTCDLGERVEGFRHVGLETPEPHDAIFYHHQQALHEDLQKAMPNCSVVKIAMRDLADDVLSKVNDCIPIQDAFVISTCPEITSPVHGEAMEVNRLYTLQGVKLGVGPRSGYPSLMDQLTNIGLQARDKRVVLVEDGIFSGGTLRKSVDLLHSRRIELEAIVAGFAFPDAQSVLHELQGEGVKVALVYDYDNLVDWMPDHDFVPFTPGCGRAVGIDPSGEADEYHGLMPLYLMKMILLLYLIYL